MASIDRSLKNPNDVKRAGKVTKMINDLISNVARKYFSPINITAKSTADEIFRFYDTFIEVFA